MSKTETANLISLQYHAMFSTPPPPPTTEQWFEHQARRYLDTNLGVQDDVDRLHNILPVSASGAVLCVFRKFRNEELAELMTHVVVNGRQGKNYLNFAYLANDPWVPNGPHLLTDVRDGRLRCNIAPNVNRANIAKEGRMGFAAIHLVLWGLYHGQDTLTHHFLDGVASRCGSGYMPFLYLCDGEPKLDAYWGGVSSLEWGAPCAGGSVLVLRS